MRGAHLSIPRISTWCRRILWARSSASLSVVSICFSVEPAGLAVLELADLIVPKGQIRASVGSTAATSGSTAGFASRSTTRASKISIPAPATFDTICSSAQVFRLRRMLGRWSSGHRTARPLSERWRPQICRNPKAFHHLFTSFFVRCPTSACRTCPVAHCFHA